MHAAGSHTAAIDTPPLSLEINNKHQDSAAVASGQVRAGTGQLTACASQQHSAPCATAEQSRLVLVLAVRWLLCPGRPVEVPTKLREIFTIFREGPILG